jgi:Myb-like DNA-binding protein FlbD
MTRTSAHRGPWHADEDQLLLDLVQKKGPNNWVRISQHMQHRTPKQCRERYHQNLKQSLNHDPITHQEGEMIERMVSDMGRRWAEIARRLGNRSDNAVKNWWNGSMNRRKRNSTQRQPGFKNMGQRAQPIPATRPPQQSYLQPPHIEYHQHLQQGPAIWSDIHQTRGNPPVVSHTHLEQMRTGLTLLQMHYSEPTNPGLYSMFDPRLVGESFSRQSHQMHSGYPEHLPVPGTLPRPYYHAPPTLHSSNGSSMDLPLISPMGSETSFSVCQAPSLVSDRHSSYSISPKTIPSPRPTMLAPIDTRAQLWHDYELRRRESLPMVQSKPSPAGDSYASAISPVGLRQYHHVSGYELPRSQSQNGYRSYQDQSTVPDMSPNSAKDARMNVSSLLH